ncbi:MULTISPECIES: ROK family protein [unclassified Paenibacillus]|uniref:ROK family protein n=1 Tax=unclassified Paenibacillus TaxID=185978 RepID=UPI000839B846|nr:MULTISPECIES: ROK family protein [unclassified Paenibacillus]NWL87517.1 ROK family protein [Paenibacillus sp. 79R4]
MSNSVIGVDIGGTNIRVGLVNEQLELVRKETALTSRFQHAEEIFEYVQRMIGKVDHHKEADSIGIALPVPWKEQTEIIYDATNIPCLEGINVEFIKRFFSGYEVHFENDVNVVTLLESERGASQAYGHSIYITVSTGIGSGIVLNNEVLHGAHGYAGEIGSMVISDNGKRHSTLYPGTLEALCSGRALEEESKKLYGSEATAHLLFDRYQQQDEKAVGVVNTWIEYFSNAIASLMQTIDPDIFVIGGAVVYNNQWLIDKIVESAKTKVFEHLSDKVNVVLSKFGPDAGVIGAGYMALKNDKGARTS